MPTLLEDLTQEASANSRRLADRLETEVRSLDELRRDANAEEQRRKQACESARAAVDYVIAGTPEADGLWNTVLDFLHGEPEGPGAERVLRSAVEVFESRLRCVRLASDLWKVAKESGVEIEELGQLDQAEKHFVKLAVRAKKALDHRINGWEPADPARLAEALSRSRGQTITAEEAGGWFRRKSQN